MTDLTVTLTGETAEKLRKLVAEARYARPEDAVADALDALDDSGDPEIERWLRDTIVARAEALDTDPSRALTSAEVRAALKRG